MGYYFHLYIYSSFRFNNVSIDMLYFKSNGVLCNHYKVLLMKMKESEIKNLIGFSIIKRMIKIVIQVTTIIISLILCIGWIIFIYFCRNFLYESLGITYIAIMTIGIYLINKIGYQIISGKTEKYFWKIIKSKMIRNKFYCLTPALLLFITVVILYFLRIIIGWTIM